MNRIAALAALLGLAGGVAARVQDGGDAPRPAALQESPRPGSGPPPFGYGFLGGHFSANEDAAISTWNDIHYGCHFADAPELEAAIRQVEAANKVLVDLGRAWQSRPPDCNLKGPWGKASHFASRVEPLLPTLKAHQDRLFALWLFDEPDVGHGGPASSELRAAVDFLHATLPGVPVFVNWFSPGNNAKVPNADWTSTTKGAGASSLEKFGKPMFLWWFNNESRPSAGAIRSRWDAFVRYHRAGIPPPIASLGWCCDGVLSGSNNDNSRELNDLLADIGRGLRQGRLLEPAGAPRLAGGADLPVAKGGDRPPSAPAPPPELRAGSRRITLAELLAAYRKVDGGKAADARRLVKGAGLDPRGFTLEQLGAASKSASWMSRRSRKGIGEVLEFLRARGEAAR